MKTKLHIILRFYFWATLYFIEGVWLRITGNTPKPIAQPSTGINLLDDGEAKLTPKPSQADALAHKAKFGMNQIPEEHKGKIIIGVILLIFFLFFGIVDFIIRLVTLIITYHIVGWIILYSLTTFIVYKVGKSIYKYFKEKRYKTTAIVIGVIWSEAKQKANLKFKTEI